MVEVGEPEESSQIVEVVRGGPVNDCADFDRVHGDLTFGDDKSEVFDLFLLKFTFLEA